MNNESFGACTIAGNMREQIFTWLRHIKIDPPCSIRVLRAPKLTPIGLCLLQFAKWVALLTLFAFSVFFVGDKLFPLNLSRFHDNSTIIYAQNEPVHIFFSRDDKWRSITTVDEVDPLYLKTLLAREDKYFYQHFGVNPYALARAAIQWIKSGHVVSGGSTITMQTARLLEPRPRKLSAKFIECLRALQLEWHYSKNEILTFYMTLAPFGGNIEGVNAATLAYFNKPPMHLSPSEVALLVALVQSPSRLNPCLYPEKAQVARSFLLDFMVAHDLIDSQRAQTQKLAPLPKAKAKPPREIPHLAWRLKKQFKSQHKIHSTIDLNLQKKIEFVLQSYKHYLPTNANAAILVVDHQQRKTAAYIASRDYFHEQEHGFVDYITAYRSPGSTLKPFIYGLGFDHGYITSDTFLIDERRRFGAYYPRNFDREIYGTVHASEALAMSLNTPVVDLLNQIGVIRFIGILKEAGITPQFPSQFESPSLAVALGGVGMSLEQLVSLYTALAAKGKVTPFAYVEEQQNNSEYQLFTPRVATQISTILKTKLDNGRLLSLKTGTSYGHRDALVLAYDNRYVIGIWIGMPDGSPLGPVYARDISVPLLQKVVNVIPRSETFAEHENESQIQLRKLVQRESQDKRHKNTPMMLFPVHDTLVEAEKSEGAYKALPLSVTGGKRPYTWLIDGEPLSAPSWQQKQFWTPQSPGFYTIAVIDANGQVDKAHIELK